MTNLVKICTRCVMDTSAGDITFDDKGVCNFCTEFYDSNTNNKNYFIDPQDSILSKTNDEIRKAAINKKYDCIVGVSGGVDSSWALVKAIENGLRPLAVHMDNGWNSELSQNNIYNLVSKLNVDLYTYVIEWGEYRRLMQAFFDADVIDVELLYDNALKKVTFGQAAKYGIKYIVSGSNTSTEGIRMPNGWNWFKNDKKNIISLAKEFQDFKIKTFPAFGLADEIYYRIIRRIKWVRYLDYVGYNKNNALKCLVNEYKFKPYPYKHYESIFTRFYQGYILPTKFGVDKRRVHLSSLIVTGQLDRDNALKILEKKPYNSDDDLKKDTKYFLKKMRWSNEDLIKYIRRPEKPHDSYPSEKKLRESLKSLIITLRGKNF
jgi:N-acetyl sugar amidotransferase